MTIASYQPVAGGIQFVYGVRPDTHEQGWRVFTPVQEGDSTVFVDSDFIAGRIPDPDEVRVPAAMRFGAPISGASIRPKPPAPFTAPPRPWCAALVRVDLPAMGRNAGVENVADYYIASGVCRRRRPRHAEPVCARRWRRRDAAGAPFGLRAHLVRPRARSARDLFRLPYQRRPARVSRPAPTRGLMRYISTRGQAPAVSFLDAVLAGMAPDGGLYVPESWPSSIFQTTRIKPAIDTYTPKQRGSSSRRSRGNDLSAEEAADACR
jgi:hypothetical protein